MAQSPCFSLLFMVTSRDRIAPNCLIRHPVLQIMALQRRVRFFARLAGFCRVGVTRDALEGLKRPHFRFWSLISIFECHVCAKGGERVAGRAVRPPKRGHPRDPESRPGLPWRSGLARSGPGAARAWIQVSARERGIPLLDGVFPARAENPNRRPSPPTRPRSGARHGAMTIETARRASLEFVCVFGQDGWRYQRTCGQSVRMISRNHARTPITTRGIIQARRICCCSQPATSYLSPSARCAPVNGLAGCYVSTIGKPHEYFDRYCQVDVERANLSRRADFLCSHRTAQVTSCQTMKARSRSSR